MALSVVIKISVRLLTYVPFDEHQFTYRMIKSTKYVCVTLNDAWISHLEKAKCLRKRFVCKFVTRLKVLNVPMKWL